MVSQNIPMFSLKEVIIHTCIKRLKAGYHQTYGNLKPDYAELLSWTAQRVLNTLLKSDALYHEIEHTILVTLTGQEILRGKHLHASPVSCEDWLHFIIALLCHDIGYVKGICHLDRVKERLYATGINGEMIALAPGSTGASLAPYHIDRGKQFVKEHFTGMEPIKVEVIQRHIELTRFPVPADEAHQDTVDYPGLARAADLMGQLSDPHYLQKMPALFHEFEETGVNQQLGYCHPQDLRLGFPNFFWNVVYPYIKEGLRHLEVTQSGKHILGNLYTNVRVVEREIFLNEIHSSAVPEEVLSLDVIKKHKPVDNRFGTLRKVGVPTNCGE